jgi:hypothetical protein
VSWDSIMAHGSVWLLAPDVVSTSHNVLMVNPTHPPGLALLSPHQPCLHIRCLLKLLLCEDLGADIEVCSYHTTQLFPAMSHIA